MLSKEKGKLKLKVLVEISKLKQWTLTIQRQQWRRVYAVPTKLMRRVHNYEGPVSNAEGIFWLLKAVALHDFIPFARLFCGY